MQVVPFAIVFLAIGAISPAPAQNLLTNPEFTQDAAGWEAALPQLLGHTSTDGNQALGAAEVEGLLILPLIEPRAGITQCVDLTSLATGEPLYASVAAKPVNHPGFRIGIAVTFYADSCEFAFVASVTVFANIPAPGWHSLSSSLGDLPAGATHGLFVAVIETPSEDPAAITRFDDAFFGSVLVFADGFESGDTGSWSATVP